MLRAPPPAMFIATAMQGLRLLNKRDPTQTGSVAKNEGYQACAGIHGGRFAESSGQRFAVARVKVATNPEKGDGTQPAALLAPMAPRYQTWLCVGGPAA